MSSPENETVPPTMSDHQTNKKGRPAYIWLVGGILVIVIIGVVYLILSGLNNEEPAAAAPATAVMPVAITDSDARPTATDDAGAIDEGEVETGSLSPGQLKDVAREDTFIMGWCIDPHPGVTNPWATDYSHQEANAMMWEGLAYWRIFADESQPWLAESMEYTKDDFTELTITLRPEAKWSDRTPVTTKDVLYTLESHLNNDQLPHHAVFEQFVTSIDAIDELTTVVTFNQPAPRFAFEVLTLKFDTGIPIVPAHILEPTDDPTAFAGGLDMPHSGPYTTIGWEQTGKILDLREDW